MKIKSKRQLRAAKNRQLNIDLRVKELAELKEKAESLRSMSGGFSHTASGKSSGRTLNVCSIPKTGPLASKVFRRETPSYPSLISMSSSPVKVRQQLTPEMEERERLAQIEIEKKKKRVGILVNKSGYQFITDEMDLTTLGRK